MTPSYGRRPMKRPLLIIAICLLLGAVANILLAWYCQRRAFALVDGPAGPFWAIMPGRTENFDPHDLWRSMRHEDWPQQPTETGVTRHIGLTVLSASAGDPREPPWYVVHECRSGWPFRALRVRETFQITPLQHSITGILPSSSDLAPFKGLGSGFPVHPIIHGFLLNTLLYAALLWLLMYGPFVLRRFLRLRRGLCPKCAYPMGESSVCSECGNTLPKRAVTT